MTCYTRVSESFVQIKFPDVSVDTCLQQEVNDDGHDLR